MYNSGLELPSVSFSSITYTNIPAGSYFIGFNLDDAGLLSKIDSTGTITAVEGGINGVIEVGSEIGSTYRIDSGNTASGKYSTVSGGKDNTASLYYATIGGGYCNTASGCHSTVSGGRLNTASGYYSMIGGGCENETLGYGSTIGGGTGNSVSNISCYSSILGGRSNVINGRCSAILGGELNCVDGSNNTFIVGSGIVTNRGGATFVNELSIMDLQDGSIGLPSGSVYYCSADSNRLYIVP